jgi:hypothetical protein
MLMRVMSSITHQSMVQDLPAPVQLQHLGLKPLPVTPLNTSPTSKRQKDGLSSPPKTAGVVAAAHQQTTLYGSAYKKVLDHKLTLHGPQDAGWRPASVYVPVDVREAERFAPDLLVTFFVLCCCFVFHFEYFKNA